MKYPGNQMEFEAKFKTEQNCIDYFESIRWKLGFVCPICGSMRYWEKSKGLLFMRLIEQAVITAPVSYKEIINQNHG